MSLPVVRQLHIDSRMARRPFRGRAASRSFDFRGAPQGGRILIPSARPHRDERNAVDSTTEMRRLVGKFALLFAFGYVLVLLGGVIALVRGSSLPLISWALILLPAAAFVPSVVDAVRLHQTSDPDRLKELWRRCALYSVIGIVLLVATAIILDRMNAS
jgi:hypothetical protein